MDGDILQYSFFYDQLPKISVDPSHYMTRVNVYDIFFRDLYRWLMWCAPRWL